eukprot:3220256-Prymnesium_polylepis.1
MCPSKDRWGRNDKSGPDAAERANLTNLCGLAPSRCGRRVPGSFVKRSCAIRSGYEAARCGQTRSRIQAPHQNNGAWDDGRLASQ